MEQIFNPYLPLNEYVPDGEPHVFDGRVYVYGSHDKSKGKAYCEEHYVVWSAPVDNLKDWRCEGTSYRRTQDPSNKRDTLQLWAPDVVKGADGRYYMYYCLSFYPEIGVAVSDSPAGPFEFYGHVHYSKDLYGGKVLEEGMPFDPAALVDDDGRVYLYYGFAPACEKEMILPKVSQEELDAMSEEADAFRYMLKSKFGENSMVVELESDMLTMKGAPAACIPGGKHAKGTGFEGHAFFEASSIRKINGLYYFVYSSHKSHELCYAVSDKPMSGYKYGGIIVSNGDIGFEGREKPSNALGNNHGGIACVGEDYYIFYHRQTNGTEFSRQGCAEKIQILPDGSIPQVEITSCGLNGAPLKAKGIYPAAIACNVMSPTNPDTIDYNNPVMRQQTRITQSSQQQYITDIKNKTVLGYKYFEDCEENQAKKLVLELRGSFKGEIIISSDEAGENVLGRREVNLDEAFWTLKETEVKLVAGRFALFISFAGEGCCEMRAFGFI